MLDLNQPIIGKTYSLFGNYVSTKYFYERVHFITDQICHTEKLSDEQLLALIQQRRKGASLSRIIELAHTSFQENITEIEAHLKSIPRYKILTDKVLFTTREQYYLYMIEFELVNRIHIEDFLKADYRIALLPYCLRETQENCRATVEQVDYQCKGCLRSCQINQVSKLLKEHDIEPYIWRRAKLKPLFRKLSSQHGRIGVLGIACIAELVSGMRRCMKAHLPVVGIPLNANRCPRWMKSFYETSVDLNALEKLLLS